MAVAPFHPVPGGFSRMSTEILYDCAPRRPAKADLQLRLSPLASPCSAWEQGEPRPVLSLARHAGNSSQGIEMKRFMHKIRVRHGPRSPVRRAKQGEPRFWRSCNRRPLQTGSSRFSRLWIDTSRAAVSALAFERKRAARRLFPRAAFRYSAANATSCSCEARSKRSRFITLVHAATKSFTNFSFESAQA
jgi:hypothetical protein